MQCKRTSDSWPVSGLQCDLRAFPQAQGAPAVADAKAAAPFCVFRRDDCLPLRGQRRFAWRPLSARQAPASRFTVAAQQGPHGTISAKQSISGVARIALMHGNRAYPARARRGDTIARMLDDLEALRGKLTELHARVRMLREENQQLRAQMNSAQVELDALRGRVSGAVRRVDDLLARLPAADAAADETVRSSAAP
jgi:hypothetical protein